jgi:hypothetical protein
VVAKAAFVHGSAVFASLAEFAVAGRVLEAK